MCQVSVTPSSHAFRLILSCISLFTCPFNDDFRVPGYMPLNDRMTVPNDLADLISYPSRHFSGHKESNRETSRSRCPVSLSSGMLFSGVIYEVKEKDLEIVSP